MKKINKILSLLIILVTMPGIYSFAQIVQPELPVACGGSIVRYGVVGYNGSSVFDWQVQGGIVINNFNDSVDIQWNNESGLRTITVTETSTWGCEGDPYQAQVLLSDISVDLGLDQAICVGDSMELVALNTGAEFFIWQNGTEETDRIMILDEGQYWVQVADANGCIASDTMNLALNPLPVVDLGNDTTVCGEDAIVTLDAGTDGYIYNWATGEVSQTVTYDNIIEDLNVWVRVEDINGCIGRDTVYIDVCSDNLTIPNAFSPNGDQQNDEWKIEELYFYPSVSIRVFDRWGNTVYLQKGSGKHWDGRDKKGNKLPMDSYHYVIDLGNGAEPIVGTVTLLR